jgi:hypothetical protein
MAHLKISACLIAFLSITPALAEDTTKANAEQWRTICASGAASCTTVSENTYKACANGKCYEVVCAADKPELACTKSEIPGARPMPRKLQASIFGLL